MAELVATFAAQFDAFTAACAAAETSLKSISSGADTVGTRLTKMSDALTGTKIIQQATLMAEAVERVGGVSTLTEKELAKVGATATEAANKLRALGQDVPPGIQNIADAANKGTSSFENMLGSITKVAGALGLAFGAGAVIGGLERLIGGALEMASAVGDASTKLGVSAEKFQGWVAAAQQAGATSEDVSTAVAKMNANLDGGNKNTVDALTKAGLSFNEIRSLAPEQAFEAIAEAIAKIPDPMTQARVAVELFGKGGQVLLPAIKDNFLEVANAAKKMSNEEVVQLKAAQDAWIEFGRQVTIVTGDVIVGVGNLVSKTTSSWKNFTVFMAEAAAGGVGFALAQENMREAVEKSLSPVKGQDVALAALTRTTHLSAEELAAQAEAAKKAAAAAEVYQADLSQYTEVLTRMNALVDGSTMTTGEWEAALIKAGASLSDVKAVTGAASGALDMMKKSIDAATAAQKKHTEEEKAATKATEDNYTAAQRLMDAFYADEAKQSGNALAKQLADNQKWFDDEYTKLLHAGGNYDSYYARLDALRLRKTQMDDAARRQELQQEQIAGDQSVLAWDAIYIKDAKLHKTDAMDVELRQVQDNLRLQLDSLDEARPDFADKWALYTADAAIQQAQIAQNYRDKALKPMTDALVKLFDAALHGWSDFKTALEGIWQEILHNFEEGLVKAMVDAWLGGLEKMAAAWTAGKWGAILGWLLGLLGGKGPEQGDTGDLPPGSPIPPPGGNRPRPQPASRGGLVTTSGIAYFQGGGIVWPWTPQGTDTVPAMLTPGERVLSVTDAQRYRGGGGGTVMVMLDGRLLAQAVVPELEGAVRRLGFA